VLARLHEEAGPKAPPIGLRFDLTVPTARYVQQFKGQLSFPFKRYQMQKVWRGERPQEGRYREFTQCDIDVIGDGALPSFYDAEVVRLMAVVTSQLPIPPVTLRVNNRNSCFTKAWALQIPPPCCVWWTNWTKLVRRKSPHFCRPTCI
jgi:histidyl-tRNA synthetase